MCVYCVCLVCIVVVLLCKNKIYSHSSEGLIGGIGLSMVGSELELEDEFVFEEALDIGEYGSEL